MTRRPETTANQYAVAYSVGLAVSTAFRFGIIHEILAHMSGKHPILKQFGKPVFRWVTVGLLLAGLLLAVYTQGNNADPMVHSVYVLDRAASILQVGLLAALFFLANSLGPLVATSCIWHRPRGRDSGQLFAGGGGHPFTGQFRMAGISRLLQYGRLSRLRRAVGLLCLGAGTSFTDHRQGRAGA